MMVYRSAPASADDPVVQAIRIAITLTQQLRSLQVGCDATHDESANRLGEAQSIVPELWRNLDEAAAQLVARGIDTSAFAAIRATQPAAMLAADNPSLDLKALPLRGQLDREYVDVVTGWNEDLVARATAACNALQDAMPTVAWSELAEQDRAIASRAADVLGLGRRNMILGYTLIGLLCTLFAAAFISTCR
jgi:hypothetical protein